MALRTDYINPEHPSIRSLAKELKTVKKTYEWLTENVNYGYGKALEREMKNNNSFAVKTDVETLEDLEGGCVEKSFLMASLARASGFKLRFALHDSKEKGGYSWQMEGGGITESFSWDHLCCIYRGRILDPTQKEMREPDARNDAACVDDYNVFMSLQTQQNIPLWVKFTEGKRVILSESPKVLAQAERGGNNVWRKVEYLALDGTSYPYTDAFCSGKKEQTLDFNPDIEKVASAKERKNLKSVLKSTEPLMKWLSKKAIERSNESYLGYA